MAKVEMNRVYYFCNEEFGLENLEKSRIKLSTVLEMNDPFELSCYKLSDKMHRRAAKKLKEDFANRFGFICFSGSFNSPVQWAHYADSHRGICLGFDVPRSELRPVNYIDSRMGFDLNAYLNMDSNGKRDWLAELMRTKNSHWGYEDESRRMFFIEGSDSEVIKGRTLYFRRFADIGVLKEVVVGCNSGISRERVKKALAGLSGLVESFKVRPAFNSFVMVRNQNKGLWK